MFNPRPVVTQTSMGLPTMPGPPSMGPPSMKPPSSGPPTTPGQCKIPGCTKPCFVEKNGRAHEFCGKTHADLYKKSMPVQQVPRPTPTMMYQAPSSQQPMFFGAPHATPGTAAL